jgi:acetylglutamate kinase
MVVQIFPIVVLAVKNLRLASELIERKTIPDEHRKVATVAKTVTNGCGRLDICSGSRPSA